MFNTSVLNAPKPTANIALATDVLSLFKQNKEPFKLLRKARLEYFYLDYLNKNFVATFENDYPNSNVYLPYLYAGMLFNTSMAWLDNDCKDDVKVLSSMIVDAIYPA